MRRQVPVALLAAMCLLSVPVATAAGAPSTVVSSPTNAADPAPAAAATGGAVVDAPAANNSTAPADPDEDVLGWENGRWYNESIAVDASDGLDRNESARLLNRTMARVEVVRGVEFDEPVDLNFRDRSEVAPLLAGNTDALPEDSVNAVYEALGFVGEDRDARAVLEEKQSTGAAAFVVRGPVPQLNLQAGDVTIVVDEGQTAYSEVVLAHELVHTLQVQELDFPYGEEFRTTTDGVNAKRAVIEGEATHVGYLYEQRCASEWDCAVPDESASPDRSTAAQGILFMDTVRYGNGAEFVAHLRERGGWDAVTDVYDDLPETTEQVIHPEKYGNEGFEEVFVDDQSGEDWLQAGSRADRVGESGLYVTTWFPSFAADSQVVLPRDDLFDSSVPAQGNLKLDYASEVTDGWAGDQLVPYTADSAAENETGFVWKTEWDTPEDAAQFRKAYLGVLTHRGAAPADREHVYRIPDDRPFGDAYHVERNGSTVLIVNAPTVANLSEIHASVAPDDGTTETTTEPPATTTAPPTTAPPTTAPPTTEPATPTPTTAPATPTDTPTSAPGSPADGANETATTDDGGTADDSSGVASTGEATTTSDGGPGFGPVVALAALAALVVVGLRRG